MTERAENLRLIGVAVLRNLRITHGYSDNSVACMPLRLIDEITSCVIQRLNARFRLAASED